MSSHDFNPDNEEQRIIRTTIHDLPKKGRVNQKIRTIANDPDMWESYEDEAPRFEKFRSGRGR